MQTGRPSDRMIPQQQIRAANHELATDAAAITIAATGIPSRGMAANRKILQTVRIRELINTPILRVTFHEVRSQRTRPNKNSMQTHQLVGF
jgi:hypothetical protein